MTKQTSETGERNLLEKQSPIQPQSFEEANLTSRELDVLNLIMLGKLNKEIADDLGICKKTVEMHLANLFRKLNVENRTEAALWAALR